MPFNVVKYTPEQLKSQFDFTMPYQNIAQYENKIPDFKSILSNWGTMSEQQRLGALHGISALPLVNVQGLNQKLSGDQGQIDAFDKMVGLLKEADTTDPSWRTYYDKNYWQGGLTNIAKVMGGAYLGGYGLNAAFPLAAGAGAGGAGAAGAGAGAAAGVPASTAPAMMLEPGGAALAGAGAGAGAGIGGAMSAPSAIAPGFGGAIAGAAVPAAIGAATGNTGGTNNNPNFLDFLLGGATGKPDNVMEMLAKYGPQLMSWYNAYKSGGEASSFQDYLRAELMKDPLDYKMPESYMNAARTYSDQNINQLATQRAGDMASIAAKRGLNRPISGEDMQKTGQFQNWRANIQSQENMRLAELPLQYGMDVWKSKLGYGQPMGKDFNQTAQFAGESVAEQMAARAKADQWNMYSKANNLNTNNTPPWLKQY